MDYYIFPRDVHASWVIAKWLQRGPLAQGMHYTVSRSGGIVSGIAPDLIANVAGTSAFDATGSDIDIGIIGERVSMEEARGHRKIRDMYLIEYADGTQTCCEFVRAGGEFEFLALPAWRVAHDAIEYAAAAPIIAEMGIEAWLEWKRRDKVAAYTGVGITCQREDGVYPVTPTKW